MVLKDMYANLPFEMRILHDHILEQEKAAAQFVEDRPVYTDQAREARLHKVSDVVIADPDHIHENILRGPTGRNIMRNYIADFMVANTEKDYFLVPFHPV